MSPSSSPGRLLIMKSLNLRMPARMPRVTASLDVGVAGALADQVAHPLAVALHAEGDRVHAAVDLEQDEGVVGVEVVDPHGWRRRPRRTPFPAARR
jgi:hypothetical protein